MYVNVPGNIFDSDSSDCGCVELTVITRLSGEVSSSSNTRQPQLAMNHYAVLIQYKSKFWTCNAYFSPQMFSEFLFINIFICKMKKKLGLEHVDNIWGKIKYRFGGWWLPNCLRMFDRTLYCGYKVVLKTITFKWTVNHNTDITCLIVQWAVHNYGALEGS